MKPYQQIPIVECGEPLVPIPLPLFAVEDPHPYVKVKAPYGDKSPYYLRQGVLERLIQAQRSLQSIHSGWQIQIFDAYRPLAVQQYMVDYAFDQTVAEKQLNPVQLTESEQQAILEQVYQFWAVPSANPATPPPHSTGAAIDITLVDTTGIPVDMGSPIDEMSPRSHPDYFATEPTSGSDTTYPSLTPEHRSRIHQRRSLLQQIMISAGFRQHPGEWWHFSYGDQYWAWLMTQDEPNKSYVACYGAV